MTPGALTGPLTAGSLTFCPGAAVTFDPAGATWDLAFGAHSMTFEVFCECRTVECGYPDVGIVCQCLECGGHVRQDAKRNGDLRIRKCWTSALDGCFLRGQF